jgi:hypothetical protein
MAVLDAASFHKTPEILKKLQDDHITSSITPPGCTGLLQPCDVWVNKFVKAILRSLMEQDLHDRLAIVAQGC